MKGKLLISSKITTTVRNKESYRALRANVDFCANAPKMILVTSSIPGEGKSTVSMNLASEIARSGKQVLLLDIDMRKSKLAETFGVLREDKKGVSDCLAGLIALEDAIWSTDIDGLNIILAGSVPPNPTELLGGSAIEEMFAKCRDAYEYVVVDAPPLASVIDAAVVCKKCDGVLFVIGSDMVSCRVAKRAIQQIERAGGRVIGSVLNKIKFSNRALYGTYGTNKYYYSNYSHYYE